MPALPSMILDQSWHPAPKFYAEAAMPHQYLVTLATYYYQYASALPCLITKDHTFVVDSKKKSLLLLAQDYYFAHDKNQRQHALLIPVADLLLQGDKNQLMP